MKSGIFLSTVSGAKKIITISLLLLMTLVVGLSTVELAIIIFQELVDPLRGNMFLEVDELLELFSFFFLVLIGIELLETIEMYLTKNVVHAEIVLLVAMIAVSRKVILLDLNAYDPLAVIGLACIIVALALSYFFIKKSHNNA